MGDNKVTISSSPSRLEKIIGIVFAFLVFAMVAYTVIMDVSIDDNKMPLLYTLIALMAGVFVATIPGFLNVDYSGKGVTMRAAGGAAAFVLVLSAMQGMSNSGEPIDNQNIFYATSYCSMTNVYGYGENASVGAAQELAIKNCIQNGGIPDCCASNVRVSQ